MDVNDLTDATRGIIREAMLEAQTRWLDEAAMAETPTLRTLANVIADVFRQEADRYKIVSREGWGGDVSSIGDTGTGHEPGEAAALPPLSGEGEELRRTAS